MHRRIVVVLVLAAFASLTLVNLPPTWNVDATSSYKLTPKAAPPAAAQEIDPPGTIDGAATPELIPDQAAYMMVFRYIASGNPEERRERIHGYLRFALGVEGEVDRTAILAVAQEFQREVDVLDKQVALIKDQHWPDPTPEVLTRLDQLQRQFDEVLQRKVALLPTKLTGAGFQQLQGQIRERVKRRMKYSPGITTPPGGPGWDHPYRPS